MLVACKCLNLIASSGQIVKNISELTNFDNIDSKTSLPISVHGVNLLELQNYRKNSKFYTECADFLRQAIGPVTDLTVSYSQADLVFEIPIDGWILHYCINCYQITYAKKNSTDNIYLINSNLLTNNEDIAQRRAEQAYSTTFGLLMIDHQRLKASSNLTSPMPTQINTAKYQNRLKRLNQNFKNRLEQEIFETDERIHRFTEQQFNLLKSFREKSEQEYQILISLLIQVPDEIQEIDAINSSNLSTTSNNQLPPNDVLSNNTNATSTSAVEFIDSNDSTSAIDNTQNSVSSQVFSYSNKNSNFDTPPATPDSTPMSIGNSPTFRQQTSVFGSGNRNSNGSKNHNDDDECLFELEGVECYPNSVLSGNNAMSDVEETEDAEDALGELDSGIPTSRYAKRSSFSMARSLPISIAPIESKINNVIDSDDEVPEDNVDIAASIKALAKSVHGDTVFGDLPRPRFSTQI